MLQLVLLALGGMIAKFIGGSLGMGYGVMSATMLLTIGIAPAAASATVHIAQIGTTLVTGFSHWRFGNVDWGVVKRIAIPGGIGAFLGASFLSSLPAAAARPLMASILLCLGAFVLIRFTRNGVPTHRIGTRIRTRFLVPLGLVGGFLDSTGGGGWGPVNTPALLASGQLEPRKVIGSVGTSEVVVAVCSVAGFLVGIGHAGIPFDIVLTLLAGGLIAAPLAAWVVRHLPGRILGSAVGGMIVITNAQTLIGESGLGLSAPLQVTFYVAFAIVWVGAIAYSIRAWRAERAEEAAVPATDASAGTS